MTLNDDNVCRLCFKQPGLVKDVDTSDLAAYVASGHQLFFADMFKGMGTQAARAAASDRRLAAANPPVPARHPVRHRQLVAFHLPRDLAALKGCDTPEPPDLHLFAYLDAVLHEHATRHGWRPQVQGRARRVLRIALALQDTPGAAINASDVTAIAVIERSVRPALDVLAAAGFLHDDRTPSVELWFERVTGDLPAPMIDELRVWLEVMQHGSQISPRRRPRAPVTARSKLRWAMPALRTWADHGHQRLREISRDQVLDALPRSGTPRHTMIQGLRSIFQILKARKLVFVNPTARIPVGKIPSRIPLPAPVDHIRQALVSNDVSRAALAALVAFHALTAAQLRVISLTDVRDGRLHLLDGNIPLADPVRTRLRAYLDYRATRWPATANPHLFINAITANQLSPVRADWISIRLGLSAQALREDRILHEVYATGGDIRRLCDLFGLSISGAERYTAVLDYPGLSTVESSSNI